MWKVADQHDKSVQQRKTLSPRQEGALSTELRELVESI